jgi:hypothetical protein
VTGCYGTCAEDRARERELNAYLDAQFKGEQRYQDALNDLADEAITDAGYIEDIFDNDPQAFFLAVSNLVFQAREGGDKAAAFSEFADFLVDGAVELKSLQTKAAEQLEDEE